MKTTRKRFRKPAAKEILLFINVALNFENILISQVSKNIELFTESWITLKRVLYISFQLFVIFSQIKIFFSFLSTMTHENSKRQNIFTDNNDNSPTFSKHFMGCSEKTFPLLVFQAVDWLFLSTRFVYTRQNCPDKRWLFGFEQLFLSHRLSLRCLELKEIWRLV